MRKKPPGATESHCIGSVSERNQTTPKVELIRPQASLWRPGRVWWQTVTDFLSVYSAPFDAFARERAALRDQRDASEYS